MNVDNDSGVRWRAVRFEDTRGRVRWQPIAGSRRQYRDDLGQAKWGNSTRNGKGPVLLASRRAAIRVAKRRILRDLKRENKYLNKADARYVETSGFEESP